MLGVYIGSKVAGENRANCCAFCNLIAREGDRGAASDSYQSPGVYFDSSLGGSRLEDEAGCVAWDMLNFHGREIPLKSVVVCLLAGRERLLVHCEVYLDINYITSELQIDK